MQAYRVETTVQPDGSLIVRHVPLQAGAAVDVMILVRPPRTSSTNPYPLRGIPVTYQNPTEPVAESDWDAAQ